MKTGRHKQSWRARELRLCSHCTGGLIEDELHFLMECSKYKHIRDANFKQMALVSPEFQQTSNRETLVHIGREGKVHPPGSAVCVLLPSNEGQRLNHFYHLCMYVRMYVCVCVCVYLCMYVLYILNVLC